jgi:hypothetical protein
MSQIPGPTGRRTDHLPVTFPIVLAARALFRRTRRARRDGGGRVRRPHVAARAGG